MDDKELKNKLKQARDSIQKKNFDEASKLCEEILRTNPDNYTSLVFAGRCQVELNNPTAAREFYTRATILDDSQLLAWQGLNQFYEKYSIWDDNCVSCLKKLISLTEEENKKREYEFQLAVTLSKSGHFDESADVFSTLMISSPDYKSRIEEMIVREFQEAIITSKERLQFIRKCFTSQIENLSVSEQQDNRETRRKELCRRYFRFLVKNRNYEDAYGLIQQFSLCGENIDKGGDDDDGFMRDLMTIFCERYLEGILDEKDEEILENLKEYFEEEESEEEEEEKKEEKKKSSTCIAALEITALREVMDRNWITVVDILKEEELKKLTKPTIFLWYLLAETKLRLHDYAGSIAAALEAERSCRDDRDKIHRLRCNLIQADALSATKSPTSLNKAFEIYSSILSSASSTTNYQQQLTSGANRGLALVAAFRGSRENALNYLSKTKIGGDSSSCSLVEYHLTEAIVHLTFEEYPECKAAIERASALIGDDEEEEVDDQKMAMLHYLRGRLLWQSGEDRNQAFKEFLESAKLDSHHADTFYHIGLYYADLKNSSSSYDEKAAKCFERAYALGGTYDYEHRIGCSLSDAYRLIGAHDKNLALLTEITTTTTPNSAGGSKSSSTWAWLRLGLEYLSQAKADEAIRVLQQIVALQQEESDSSGDSPSADDDVVLRCWECLGEAYAIRGSYSAASKAFQKASTLETDPSKVVYANYRLASIDLVLNRYDEAAGQFEKILHLKPDHLPSLVGFGQSLLRSADSYFDEGRFQRSLDTYAKVIKILAPRMVVAAKSSSTAVNNCPSIWYLIGSASTNLGSRFPNCRLSESHHHDQDLCNLMASLEGRKTAAESNNNVDPVLLLKFGARCFAQVIRLRAEESENKSSPPPAQVWHDLGMNLYFQQALSRKSGGTTNGESDEQQLAAAISQQQCVDCLKHAIRSDPSNPRFWLSLGNVLTSSNQTAEHSGDNNCEEDKSAVLAQHCFIKSLSLEPHQASAWTGLGVLYLKFGELGQAHKCFERAQGLDPDYAQCWIGQAAIAERCQPKDALDLFRHVVELGNKDQAYLGYAYHVLKTISNPNADVRSSEEYKYAIEHLRAIPTALIAMQKYCWLNPWDPCALNMLALLFELEGMLPSAANAYSRALEILEKSPRSDGANLEARQLVSANACRLFGKHRNRSMIDIEKNIPTTFENSCMLALAYYRSGQMDKAAKCYSGSLYTANSKDDELAVNFALNLIAAAQGDWSKNLDFLKVQMKGFDENNCAPMLFWMAICGLLENATLVDINVTDLRKGVNALAKLGNSSAEWTKALAGVCSLYAKAFTLPPIQRMLHLLPYDKNIRITFYRVWTQYQQEIKFLNLQPLNALSGGIDFPSSDWCKIDHHLTIWQALCNLKEWRSSGSAGLVYTKQQQDQQKQQSELLYSQIKHQYPDILL